MNNVFKEFLKYVSLNICGQMVYSCYTLADTFFVSADMGAKGLTALNLAFPVFCILSGTGLMIGMGGSTNYTIQKSRGEEEAANRIFTSSFCLAALCSVFFVFLGLFFSDSLVRMLGADDTMFSMTHTYLRVLLLFSPAFLFNHLFQCFVRNDGNPSLSTKAMVTGSCANILLDYIFIFPLGMGIFGAIFATGLAPVISMIILSAYGIAKKNQFHLVKEIQITKRISVILSSGIPSFLTEATSGIVMLLFNFIILRLTGNTGVAAFSIVTVVSLVVVAIYTGLSQGIQPVLSKNYGIQNQANVKAVLNYSIMTMLLLSGVIYSVIFFHASSIAFLFNSEKNRQLQEFAVTGLRLYFMACPFIGLNIVLSTYLASTEHPVPAQIISLSRGCILLIPIAFLLSTLFRMTGVWCAYPVTECCVSFIGSILFLFTLKNARKK